MTLSINPNESDRPMERGGGISSRLNSLLRGEISAAETYKMALDRFGLPDEDVNHNHGLLRDMQEEHGRAAQAVRERIEQLGAEASDSSGVWGIWAKFTQRTANLFGDAAALKALKEGEEHGLKEYEEALDSVDPGSVRLINNQLIPAQRRHCEQLDQLIWAAQAG